MIRVVVITDRAPDVLVRASAIAAAVGRDVRFQVRERDLDGGAVLELTRALIAIVRPHGAEVWVNDRVDVALAAGADGVQLPERGISIADARALGGGLALGCSRHSIEGAIEAARAGADAVHLGPIWSTPSKDGILAPLGAETLGRRLGAPLIAVGGIDVARARDAARAGADAVAVIRAAWTTEDPAATIAAMCDAVKTARSGS